MDKNDPNFKWKDTPHNPPLTRKEQRESFARAHESVRNAKDFSKLFNRGNKK